MNIQEINFTEVKEHWFSYKLPDKTTLKLRPILIKVIDEGKDEQGNLRFSLQATNVVGTFISKDSDEKMFKKPEKDLKPDPLNDDWNEYELEPDTGNKIVLKLKPVIAQIDRTGELDSKGLPTYAIQSQQLIRLER